MTTPLTPVRFAAEYATQSTMGPKGLLMPIALLAPGLAGQQVDVQKLVLKGGGREMHVDPWPMFEHLGEYGVIDLNPGELSFKLPEPQDMAQLLEHSRRQWLNMLQAPPEVLRQHVAFAGVVSDEELRASNRKSTPTYLTMIDVLLLYVRQRWQVLPDPPDGVLAGLFEEIELFCRQLPEKSERNSESQAVLEHFAVEVERVSGLRLPNLGQRQGPRTRHGDRARELYDPERLTWYFELPTYLEMRALSSNRYAYVVLIFRDNRVVVDTAQKENRAFLWRGPLADVLPAIDTALSGTSIKGTMEGHSLCIEAHDHSEEGIEAVRRFLA